MKKYGQAAGLFSMIGLCLAMGAPDAHLVAGSLTPASGTFTTGTTMAIHWVIEQEHSGNYQISFSPKGPLNNYRSISGAFDSDELCNSNLHGIPLI